MSQAEVLADYRAKSVAKFMSAIGMSSTKHRSIILPMRQVITSGFMSIPSAPQKNPLTVPPSRTATLRCRSIPC